MWYKYFLILTLTLTLILTLILTLTLILILILTLILILIQALIMMEIIKWNVIYIPYSPENKHPFFAHNAGQSPHNSGQIRHNAGKGCLFSGGAYFRDYTVMKWFSKMKCNIYNVNDLMKWFFFECNIHNEVIFLN